jgi:hypothetical protein
MLPICSSVKCRKAIASVGHIAAQVPQPLHKASLTEATGNLCCGINSAAQKRRRLVEMASATLRILA